jgi:hypothetical protein
MLHDDPTKHRDPTTSRRSVLRRMALGAIGVSALSRALGEDQTDKKEAFGDIGELNISRPIVGINGPFQHLLRTAKIGDLIVCEISYPIIPVTPKSAVIVPSTPALAPVGVYHAANEVVVLNIHPQKGPIGIGILAVALKAMSAGNCKVTVKVKMTDGTEKDVLFDFNVM